MTQNKSELRISSFFLGTLLCYLPPPLYPTLLITLNAILVASSAIFFSTYHRSQDIFRQVSLAAIFFWELSPHLRLFLMVRPLGPTFFFNPQRDWHIEIRKQKQNEFW